jgi:hypothetical protein
VVSALSRDLAPPTPSRPFRLEPASWRRHLSRDRFSISTSQTTEARSRRQSTSGTGERHLVGEVGWVRSISGFAGSGGRSRGGGAVLGPVPPR